MDKLLLPYRLKSARRKKRLQKEDRDKQLRKLDKKHSDLQRQQRELPMVPLDVPYQKGWIRLFVLKKAVQKSDKAEFYQGILDKINHVQYHYDQSFKKRKRGKWYSRYNLELPTLKPIHPYEWHGSRLKLTDEERLHFNRVEYWDVKSRIRRVIYEFAEPWLFEIAVLPHIVDKVKLNDQLLAQEIAYIGNHIINHHLYPSISKLLAGSTYNRRKSWGEKPQYINPLKNVPVYLAEDYA